MCNVLREYNIKRMCSLKQLARFQTFAVKSHLLTVQGLCLCVKHLSSHGFCRDKLANTLLKVHILTVHNRHYNASNYTALFLLFNDVMLRLPPASLPRLPLAPWREAAHFSVSTFCNLSSPNRDFYAAELWPPLPELWVRGERSSPLKEAYRGFSHAVAE